MAEQVPKLFFQAARPWASKCLHRARSNPRGRSTTRPARCCSGCHHPGTLGTSQGSSTDPSTQRTPAQRMQSTAPHWRVEHLLLPMQCSLAGKLAQLPNDNRKILSQGLILQMRTNPSRPSTGASPCCSGEQFQQTPRTRRHEHLQNLPRYC